MSTSRPTEADVEALAEQVWASFKTSPFFHVTRPFAKSIARTILASDWLAARDAEHQREVEALRRAVDKAYDAFDIASRSAVRRLARAEAAERDRDEARRELDDLRAKVAAELNSEDAHAALYGVTGTHPESYGGVTKDEALECAGELLTRLRALLPTEDGQ